MVAGAQSKLAHNIHSVTTRVSQTIRLRNAGVGSPQPRFGTTTSTCRALTFRAIWDTYTLKKNGPKATTMRITAADCSCELPAVNVADSPEQFPLRPRRHHRRRDHLARASSLDLSVLVGENDDYSESRGRCCVRRSLTSMGTGAYQGPYTFSILQLDALMNSACPLCGYFA